MTYWVIRPSVTNGKQLGQAIRATTILVASGLTGINALSSKTISKLITIDRVSNNKDSSSSSMTMRETSTASVNTRESGRIRMGMSQPAMSRGSKILRVEINSIARLPTGMQKAKNTHFTTPTTSTSVSKKSLMNIETTSSVVGREGESLRIHYIASLTAWTICSNVKKLTVATNKTFNSTASGITRKSQLSSIGSEWDARAKVIRSTRLLKTGTMSKNRIHTVKLTQQVATCASYSGAHSSLSLYDSWEV